MDEIREAVYRLSVEGHLKQRGLCMEDTRGMMLPGDMGDGVPIDEYEEDDLSDLEDDPDYLRERIRSLEEQLKAVIEDRDMLAETVKALRAPAIDNAATAADELDADLDDEQEA